MQAPETENKLAQSLRDCCDESGREINVAKSASMLHKLGLIYRKRSPDKISLIQSVGLLNAALVRDPTNPLQIQSDLSEVCLNILKLSDAKQQTVDLIYKAKDVKKSIKDLRSKVVEFFYSVEVDQIPPNAKRQNLHEREERKILAIQNVSVLICNEYKSIMAQLCKYCENVMGPPPCEYSVAGMGSLARKEITPYSDFEHILLLEDHENYATNVEYFRWMSVIFHVIVLNLQETIVPSLNILSLSPWFFDAITPRGISFDGMMPHACKFPLGRQKPTDKKPWTTELILPVSKMLKYLSSEEDLKNGYHLKDILTKTCHVFGNEKIYDQFANGARLFLKNKTQQERTEDVTQQVKDDLDQFSARFRLTNLRSIDTINIKQMIYRSSTLFISALATIHGISANSCFEVISEMAHKKIVTQKTKHKLLYAVAIACEVRLRVYVSNQSQCDNAIHLKEERTSSIKKFLNIVGETSMLSYFQITYCLQCEIAKQLKFTKLHFYSNPQLINLALSSAFEMQKYNINKLLQSSSGVWNINDFDFDSCLENISSNFTLAPKLTRDANSASPEQICSIANQLQSLTMYDEALELYKYVASELDSQPKNESRDRYIAEVLCHIGWCFLRMHRYNDSLFHFKKSLKIYQSFSEDESNDVDISHVLNVIGIALYNLQDYESSLEYYNRSLKVELSTSRNVDFDANVSARYNNIGLVLQDLHRYGESLIYLKKGLQIDERLTLDKDTDRSIAYASGNLGLCYQSLKQYDKSLTCFKRTLNIFQNVTVDEEKDPFIAEVHRDMGLLFIDTSRLNDAYNQLHKSLKIYRNKSLDESKDRNVAEALYNLAICLHDMQQTDEAVESFKTASNIYEALKLLDVEGKDIDLKERLRKIDRFLHKLQSKHYSKNSQS